MAIEVDLGLNPIFSNRETYIPRGNNTTEASDSCKNASKVAINVATPSTNLQKVTGPIKQSSSLLTAKV